MESLPQLIARLDSYFRDPFPKQMEQSFSSEELFENDLSALLNKERNIRIGREYLFSSVLGEIAPNTDSKEVITIDEVTALEQSYGSYVHNAFMRIHEDLDALSYWDLAILLGKPSPSLSTTNFIFTARQLDPEHDQFYFQLEQNAQAALERKGTALAQEIETRIARADFKNRSEYDQVVDFTYGWLCRGLNRKKKNSTLVKIALQASIRFDEDLDALSYWDLAILLGKPSPSLSTTNFISTARQLDHEHDQFYFQLEQNAQAALERKGTALAQEIETRIARADFESRSEYKSVVNFTYGWLCRGLNRKEKDSKKAEIAAITTELTDIFKNQKKHQRYSILTVKTLSYRARSAEENDDYSYDDIGVFSDKLNKVITDVDYLGRDVSVPLKRAFEKYVSRQIADHQSTASSLCRPYEKKLFVKEILAPLAKRLEILSEVSFNDQIPIKGYILLNEI